MRRYALTDCIDGRTAVSDISSYRDGNYMSFIFFFIIFIIKLTVKWFMTDFEFFFIRKFSLSFSPVLIKNGGLIGDI